MAEDTNPSKRQRSEETNGKKKPLESDGKSCCCFRLVLDDHDSEDLSLETDEPLLPFLLQPLDARSFLQTHFRQCAVHVQAKSRRNRFQAILQEFLSSPSDIFQQTSSDNIFCWLQVNVPGKDKPLIHSMEVSSPETALALYQAGHPTYCRAPPPLEQALVQALLRETGLGCGQYDPTGNTWTCLGRGEVEVFLSRSSGHVTDWHVDFQENFTLQLSGRKKWRLSMEPTPGQKLQHPLRGCTPHYQAPDVVEGQIKAGRLANEEYILATDVATFVLGSVPWIIAISFVPKVEE